MPEVVDRVISTKLENQNELDWLSRERMKEPEKSILSSPWGKELMMRSNRKKSNRTIETYGGGRISETETQYTNDTRPTFKQRLKSYWELRDSQNTWKKVQEKVKKLKENQSERDGFGDDLPLTLPAGALGAHEVWEPKPAEPSTPTEIIYESEESEEELSPPRTPVREPTPPPMRKSSSSSLDLTGDENAFRPSNKKYNGDEFNLHLREDEYDSENNPAPKFKREKSKHLMDDTRSVRSKYNRGRKSPESNRGSPPWRPTNISPGFEPPKIRRSPSPESQRGRY